MPRMIDYDIPWVQLCFSEGSQVQLDRIVDISLKITNLVTAIQELDGHDQEAKIYLEQISELFQEHIELSKFASSKDNTDL